MAYIFYGINRICRDFLYVFDDIEVAFLTDDVVGCKNIWGHNVISLKEAIGYCKTIPIIICDVDKEKKESVLNENGLLYGKDYFYEEDFFDSLNSFKIPTERKIAIWGTGNMAHYFLSEAVSVSPDIFIETNRTKDTFAEKKVFQPEEIQLDEYFIIVAINKDRDVIRLLEEAGLDRLKDYCSYMDILGQPSEMLKKTIFDNSYYDLECHTMLNHLEILNEGKTRCCCTTFVSQDLDCILDNKEDIWNSAKHKIMCLSQENRTYSFCTKSMCPLFVSKCKKDGAFEVPGWDYEKMNDRPSVLALGYDPSCNLACSTCRKCTYYAKGKDKERIDRISEIIIEDYLEKCEFLIVAGDGEFFACQSYKSIIESEHCNPRFIRLLTNGTLFTDDRWKFLKKNCPNTVFLMTVSIDAATKRTYESIRRNGNFEALKKNMEFAASLKKQGELKYLRFNFVVQRDNYREMPLFVEWGEELGIDEVFFTKILNWGTYSKEEFSQISMFEEDGITPKKELVEVLADPRIAESTIVDLGTIQYLHKHDEVGIVNNYYKWELEKRGGRIFI